MKPKTLTLDIETFPMVGTFWGLFETNPLWVIKPSVICCFSAKWLGGEQFTFALCDFKGYKAGNEDSLQLLQKLHELIDEAEIVLGQNHKRFDMKMINTEFLKHHLSPPSPYKMIDTLQEAKKHFKFPSNKLDSMGADLNEGRKMEHEGAALWKKCMAGDMDAWARMKKYNAQDVRLTERVYRRFIPWIENHPQAKMRENPYGRCTNCGSKKLQSRGYDWARNIKFQRFHCLGCGAWNKSKIKA